MSLSKLPDLTLPRYEKASAIAKLTQTERKFTMLLRAPTIGGGYAAAHLYLVLTGQTICYLQHMERNSAKFIIVALMKVKAVP